MQYPEKGVHLKNAGKIIIKEKCMKLAYVP